MSRVLYKVLDIHHIVPKSCFGLLLSCRKRLSELLPGLRHTHSFSAAAKSCLYNDRISDPVRFFYSRLFIKYRLRTSRNDRNTGRYHCISRLGLITKLFDHFCPRPDECNVALLTKLCKSAVLGEKSKSRMNGICPGNHRRAQNFIHAQIALCRWCGTNTDCLIRKLCVQCFFVRF